MQNTHRALVLHEFGKTPLLEEVPKPAPGPGQLLVKVDASTINPSDRLRLAGVYGQMTLPGTPGLEGTGHVQEANGEELQAWKGKRVCFMSDGSGCWGEFALAKPDWTFEIEEDVPMSSAASGLVNPLTVIGMIQIYYKTPGKKGIIHTAAASALGRMLNKRCQTLGIPLLNVVRKQEQADLLKSEGAQHVIVTTGEWEGDYLALMKEHGFNVFFDCLGGGSVLETLVTGLNPGSFVHLYGALEKAPFQLKNAVATVMKGVTIGGYMMPSWWAHLSAEEKAMTKKDYGGLLKKDLATHLFKQLPMSEISEALELSVSKAT